MPSSPRATERAVTIRQPVVVMMAPAPAGYASWNLTLGLEVAYPASLVAPLPLTLPASDHPTGVAAGDPTAAGAAVIDNQLHLAILPRANRRENPRIWSPSSACCPVMACWSCPPAPAPET